MPSDCYRVYVCQVWCVDSSSRLPFSARTNRQTRLNVLPTPAAIRPASVINNSTAIQLYLNTGPVDCHADLVPDDKRVGYSFDLYRELPVGLNGSIILSLKQAASLQSPTAAQYLPAMQRRQRRRTDRSAAGPRIHDFRFKDPPSFARTSYDPRTTSFDWGFPRRAGFSPKPAVNLPHPRI